MFALGVSTVCALYATTWKAEHSVLGVRSLSRKCPTDTDIQNKTKTNKTNSSLGTQCLNLHALGEQWIEKVTDVDTVRTTPEECLEGEHLKFKAHIRGWKAVTRERRCQSLLEKTEHNLRKALLGTPWKDVLLVPQAWYPEHTPK